MRRCSSAEDYDLWLRLALESEVAIVDEPLVYVRHHDGKSQPRMGKRVRRAGSLARLGQELVGPRRRSLLRKERMRNALKLAATHAKLGARGRHAARPAQERAVLLGLSASGGSVP